MDHFDIQAVHIRNIPTTNVKHTPLSERRSQWVPIEAYRQEKGRHLEPIMLLSIGYYNAGAQRTA